VSAELNVRASDGDLSDMTEQGSWRSYRIGKALLWGGFILYLPCVLILSFAFEALGMPGDLVAVGAFAWMALWVVNGLL